MTKPFIPGLLPLETLSLEPIIPVLTNAHSALARYDGRLEAIPNPAVLLSPLTTKEAVLSSKIEGTQATLEEVLEFEADPEVPASKYEDIEEIINYRHAMRHAESELQTRPMSLNLIKTVHLGLLDGVRGRDKGRGTFRTIQNWIGTERAPIEQARYVPPSPETMNDALHNWEKYYHFVDRDRLVQLAIIHAQFEIIHPFIDGNGRIGRMLIPLFLFEKQVLSSPMFYISAFLEETRDEYYDRLLNITAQGDWIGWIRYFLGAVSEQARRNGEQAKEIMTLYNKTKDKVAELTRSRFAIQTLDFLFNKPIFRSSIFSTQSGIPKPSIARILKCLEQGEVLRIVRPSSGRQPAIYAFENLLEIVR